MAPRPTTNDRRRPRPWDSSRSSLTWARLARTRRSSGATVAVTAPTALRVVVTDARGRRVPADGLDRWLVRLAPTAAQGEVAVALVSDAKMRALNRRFLGRDRTTDVLSFPADVDAMCSRSGPRLLGDVVIAKGVATRQARSAGYRVRLELRRLALHGLLHLLGYDHDRDGGRMDRVERRLLRKGGIPEHAT